MPDRCPDFPPPDDDPIGVDRARVYVAWLRTASPPLLAEATRMIRERHGDVTVTTHAATVKQLASWTLSPAMAGLSIGTVAAWIHSGDLAMVNLSLRRDGTLVLVPGKNMR